MDLASRHEQRVVWALWIACGLAAVGGLAPLVLGGGSNRINGALIPFAVAAIGLGACALLYQQGRAVTSGLYFVASLAIVYGILAMLAVPLRVAVLGTCPPAAASCAAGFERPMTGGETTAMGFAVGMGIVAILTGFFGLVTLYRRQTVVLPLTPPVRRIAPVGTRTPAEEGPASPAAPPTAPEPEAQIASEVPTPQPEPELELPAHAAELELPAHAEELETGEAAPAPAPEAVPETSTASARKPPRRRTPKAPPPDSPSPSNAES